MKIKAPLIYRAAGRKNLQLAANIAHAEFTYLAPVVRNSEAIEKSASYVIEIKLSHNKPGFFSSILTSILVSLMIRFAVWLIRRWWENRTTTPFPSTPVVE